MISLEKSVRTCKVDTAWANRLESDRFLNSNLMLCPPWNGFDTAGRPACWDSYYTKTPGCNSASDRVVVENGLRPQYIEYVNLDASGIRGEQQCDAQNRSSQINPDTLCHQNTMRNIHGNGDPSKAITGQFGLNSGYSQNIFPNCMSCQNYPSQRAYGQNEQQNGPIAENYGRSFQKRRSGFW